MTFVSAALALCLTGCFESHRVEGGDGGTGACGGGPPQCYFYDGAEACCTDSGPPAECGEAGWACPRSSRREFDCPAFCGAGGCAGEPPSCVAVRDATTGPCCDLSRRTAAACAGDRWECPEGHVVDTACAEIGRCGACDGLGAAACLRDGCAPVYDDRCCPQCGPEPFCADCTDWVFLRCEAFEERCDTGSPACGRVPAGVCNDRVLDCAGAIPTSDEGCSVPGCVPAVRAECTGCGAECVPVRVDNCVAECPVEPPACPDGTVPEADGCYTGRCIPARVCAG